MPAGKVIFMELFGLDKKEKAALEARLAEKEKLIAKLTKAMEEMVKMARQLNENNKKLTELNDQLIAINNALLDGYTDPDKAQLKEKAGA